MTRKVELTVLDHFISRICHELVGPVSAVNNGLELIAEEGGADGEALDLVTASGRSASARLQFFRMAYGRAGADVTNLSELRAVAMGLFAGERLRLEWSLPPILPPLDPGEGRILLSLIAVASDALEREGEVSVEIEDDRLVVVADGPQAGLDGALKALVSGDSRVEEGEMSPRNVHGLIAALYCEALGRKVSLEEESGSIRLICQRQ